MYFGRDIETIQKIYQRHRNDPPVAWDLPPIAGKIAWARQMYRRIQEPMEMFQKYPTILQTPEAKKIIKNYNKLAKVLLEFEVLYHQAWMQQVWYKLSKHKVSVSPSSIYTVYSFLGVLYKEKASVKFASFLVALFVSLLLSSALVWRNHVSTSRDVRI